MKSSRLLWLTGIGGVGLVVIGSALLYRERRQSLGLGRVATRRLPQAPVIDGYDDGDMRTQIRESADMPIEQRLATIQELVYKSVQDPQMRKLALQITRGCKERDGECEARAVYDYVKRNIRYTGDIAPIRLHDGSVEGIDLYQSARRTLEIGGGDCDDQSILNATLLALNGITPILRVVATNKRGDWEHIYTGAVLPKYAPSKFFALDTTLPGSNKFGVEAPHAKSLDFPA